MESPRLQLSLFLALAGLTLPQLSASASCFYPEIRKGQEVEILECIPAEDYFESHFDELHPPSDTAEPERPREVFAHQLANQPGVVLRVKVLQRRDYSDRREETGGRRYRWESSWEEQTPAEETLLYLRQETSACDAIHPGATVALIWAPQCCDTGYYGEIGCHLDLGMVQELPDDLRPRE